MILLLTILFPIISGIIISIPEMENRKRHIFYVAALFITDILGAITILNGGSARLFAFTDKVSAYFTTDGIGRYFSAADTAALVISCRTSGMDVSVAISKHRYNLTRLPARHTASMAPKQTK